MISLMAQILLRWQIAQIEFDIFCRDLEAGN